MQVLIVDDEPLAQEVLERYIARTPGLVLAGSCLNALEAMDFLSKQRVDLMLLDINMPEISGIDFLRSQRELPPTILTTAYPEFAVAGFELDVIDYLLKPVPFERFLKAIQKVKSMAASAAQAGEPHPSQAKVQFVRTDGKLLRIDPLELAIIEGLKDYVRLWTGDTRIIVHTTMKGIEESLRPNPAFLRISKSYIVNLAHISAVEGNTITVKGQQLAIGATYKDQVMEVINRHKLL